MVVIKNNPWFQELNFTIFCDGKRVSIIFYPTVEKKEWQQGMRSEFSLVIWACKRCLGGYGNAQWLWVVVGDRYKALPTLLIPCF